MKLIHISDLHIGKKVNEFSMLEDQKWILQQILTIIRKEQPTGVIISGDIYDKGIPTGESVGVLDAFLTTIAHAAIPVYLISGNHDSPERLNFGSQMLPKSGIHIAALFQGKIQKEQLTDEFGVCNLYLLPYLKPAMLHPWYPCCTSETSMEEAFQILFSQTEIHPEERNLLLAHQFVKAVGTMPEQCDSETSSIGGTDAIDSAIFAPFDYVALGHLHSAQSIGRDTIRYAGSPLKYSFSEIHQKKSLTLLEWNEKKAITVTKIPLLPKRDMRQIRGTLDELWKYADDSEDFIQAILTDKEEQYDPIGKLRTKYPNILSVEYDRIWQEKERETVLSEEGKLRKKTPVDLFGEFYKMQNGLELSEEKKAIVTNFLEIAWEGKKK